MTVEYKERYTVSEKHREEIITAMKEKGPMKPWTLLSGIDAPHRAMKEMVLDGTLYINSEADLYIHEHK